MKNTAETRALIAEIVVDHMSYRDLKRGLMYELQHRYRTEDDLFTNTVDLLRENDMLPTDDSTPIYEDERE
jgi:hypothetical protein